MKYVKLLGILLFPFALVGAEIKATTKSNIKGLLAGLLAFFIFCGFWGAVIGTDQQPIETVDKTDELIKWKTLAEERGETIKDMKKQEKSDKRLNITAQPKTSAKPKEYTFGPGNYVAGKDFEPGTYDIIAVKGGGNVFTDDGFDSLNLIMGVHDREMYSKEYKNAEIKRGNKLQIVRVTIKLVPNP